MLRNGHSTAEGMKPMRMTHLKMMVVALAAAGTAGAAPAPRQSPARPGELVLYEQANFNGDTYEIDRDNSSIHTDWNVHSIAIHQGDSWQICNKTRFQWQCITLTQSYPDASAIGVMGQVPSAKRLSSASKP